MKRIIGIIAICMLFITTKASAQDQEGLFSLSANASYGTEIKSLGIGLRGQYGFTSNVRGMAEFKTYLSKDNWKAWEINADAQYVFGSSDELLFYPLVGLKYSHWTLDYSDLAKIPGFGGLEDYKLKTSHNRVGVNLGVGSQIALAEKVFLQPEIRYELVKDFSQFVFMCGITYQF